MGVRKTVLPIIISTLILTIGLSLDAFADTESPSIIHAPDRLIVKFNPGVSEEKQASILSSQSASVLNHLPLLDIKIISVPEPALDAVLNALSNNNSVEFAEYDIAVPPNVIPDDTRYDDQWHLPKIGAPGAYDITYGDGPPIVILDSGIDRDHSDLSSQIMLNSEFNGYTNQIEPVDHQNGCGHGTPVAGAAAAKANNTNGIAGVGWDTEIIPVKITDDTSTSSTKCYGWSHAVLNGVEWGVSHGAKVVNLSYGFDGGSSSVRAAAQLLQENNGWLVISAGNGYGLENKVGDSRIIFVSATTSSDVLSGFSSYGDYVTLSAPGSSILTTSDDDRYGYWSGTSFSAPITASVLNLIYSVNPNLTSTEAYDFLINSAVDLGPVGWDIQYGHGRVDAYAAVYAASGNGPPITAVNDAYNTDEETLLDIAAPGVLANDSDPSGGSLTAVLGSGATNGVLNLSPDGSFTYTPNGNFDGVDSFTYQANNGTNNSNFATVTLTVNPINDAPVAEDDSDETLEGTAVVIDVLANDSDVDDDTLSIQQVTQGDTGSVSITGSTVTYTPDPGQTNSDSFTYTINDGNGGTDDATVDVTVNPIIDVHAGDLEITKSGKKRWTAEANVTVHDDDHIPVFGLTVYGNWTGGSSGTDSCETNSNGWCLTSMTTRGESLTFTVDDITGFGFEYTVSNHDYNGNSDGTTITINKDGTMPGQNSPPVAVDDDSIETNQDQPVDVDVLSNDSDPDGDPISVESVTDGAKGSVTNNSGMVTYTPGAGNMGLDSFTYTISDGNGGTSTATVSVTINGPVSETLVHLGNLVGAPSSKGPWNIGTVEITVHKLDGTTHSPLSGVVVSGIWSDLFSGTDSCTTNESGKCSVTDRIKGNSGNANFTVQNMTGSGIVYDSGSNDILDNFISFFVP